MEEEGGVEIRQQGELAGRPAVDDQQIQAEVDDTDDPMDKETRRLPRLSSHATGDRPSPFSTAWDTHPAACWTPDKDNAVPSRMGRTSKQVRFLGNKDDVRMSMLPPPCECSSEDLALRVERDVVRVHRMRSSQLRKGRKVFEYLVDELSTWITEDQLRISLSPALLAELKASSYPLHKAQSDVHLEQPATPINDEHCHTPRASRSPSTLPGPILLGESEQDTQKEISSDTHHSMNTNYDHNTCDTDEDPRPAKR